MAASSASMAAASRLLNPRSPALQSLIRRHLLLHPSSAACQSFDLPRLGEGAAADSPVRYPSSGAACPNLRVPPILQCPLGFSPIRIEAARTYVPKEDDYEDFGEDDDGEDVDDGDVDEDDVDIQDYSGSDLDEE